MNLKHLEEEYCVVQSASPNCEGRISCIFFSQET